MIGGGTAQTIVTLRTTPIRATVQIVGYDQAPDPALAIASDGNVERTALAPGTTLSFALKDRRCAGRIEDGDHVSCDRTDAPWCAAHTRTWICARCRGDCRLETADCVVPHAVYLALFAPDIVKVGVTKRWRVERRLLEQGADRGAVVYPAANGRMARRIERSLGRQFPDRIRIADKIAGLRRPLEEHGCQRTLDQYPPITTYRLDYQLALRSQPIPATLAQGTVRGVKGRLLVLEVDDSVYVTDLRALVGHVITTDTSGSPPLQQGLTAFE